MSFVKLGNEKGVYHVFTNVNYIDANLTNKQTYWRDGGFEFTYEVKTEKGEIHRPTAFLTKEFIVKVFQNLKNNTFFKHTTLSDGVEYENGIFQVTAKHLLYKTNEKAMALLMFQNIHLTHNS